MLTAMEKMTVGDEDRPNEPISITGATVFVNPFKDEEEEERIAADKVSSTTAAQSEIVIPADAVHMDLCILRLHAQLLEKVQLSTKCNSIVGMLVSTGQAKTDVQYPQRSLSCQCFVRLYRALQRMGLPGGQQLSLTGGWVQCFLRAQAREAGFDRPARSPAGRCPHLARPEAGPGRPRYFQGPTSTLMPLAGARRC